MVMGSLRQETDIVVIGGGPGGYVAAIRAADLGREVLLVDERERRGGVCLLEGCIPSKTLIHAVELIHDADRAGRIGLSFGPPTIDLPKLREWTDSVVSGLSAGIDGLLKRRGVEVVRGRARFQGPNSLSLEGSEVSGIDFKQAIVATGSRSRRLSSAPDLELWSSTDALALTEIPDRLLVVGGGYIGLELGLVYAGLGSQVSVVEFAPRLLAGADPDLVAVMVRSAKERLHEVLSDSKVKGVVENDSGSFEVSIEHRGETLVRQADRVLVSIGRRPNTDDLDLRKAGVEVNSAGFIVTDEACRTNVPHIYAIGDVTPGPMLAHKASREGKVAAEVIAGEPSAFDNRAVPAVVFTDPEIAWTGVTEEEAKAKGIDVKVGTFPLSALGRARTLGRTDGLVKVLTDPTSGLLLGVGMVGVSASELVAEATLALEMGATVEDLMVTIHPHPTLSESLMEAAEVAAGAPIHVVPPRRKG